MSKLHNMICGLVGSLGLALLMSLALLGVATTNG